MDRKSFSITRIGEFAVLDRRLKRNRRLLARFICTLCNERNSQRDATTPARTLSRSKDEESCLGYPSAPT
jgi:hypothetical protein